MAFSSQTNINSLIAFTNFEKSSAELDDVSKVMSTGSNFRVLEQQTKYLEILKDASETGLGNIVDTDMGPCQCRTNILASPKRISRTDP